MEISLGMSESEASSSCWRGSPVGDYIKSTSGWNDYNGNSGNGSNSSGFDGRPGGWTFYAGFFNLGDDAHWWSSPASDTSSTWIRELNHSDNVGRDILSSYFGFSARCVIDYTDECGVLNGDNSTCADECGVPNGDNSTCFTTCGDLVSHESYDYSTVQIGDQCWFC